MNFIEWPSICAWLSCECAWVSDPIFRPAAGECSCSTLYFKRTGSLMAAAVEWRRAINTTHSMKFTNFPRCCPPPKADWISPILVSFSMHIAMHRRRDDVCPVSASRFYGVVLFCPRDSNHSVPKPSRRRLDILA